MKTETKVIVGILAATAIIIFIGISLFKQKMAPDQVNDYSKYIKTDLNLDKTKLSRDYNPKISGINNSSSTASTTASTTIHITEFLDYKCGACANMGEPIVKSLLEKYGSNIIITKKIFPIHGKESIDIASIVLASQIFGDEVYKNVHSKIFETQNDWAILGKTDRENYIKKLILDMGIDYDKLYTESKKQKYIDQISQDKQDAIDFGIKATPSFIIENHTLITGGLPIEQIIKYIDNK